MDKELCSFCLQDLTYGSTRIPAGLRWDCEDCETQSSV